MIRERRSVVKIASWMLFVIALAISSFLTLILLAAFANFGFGQVFAAGPAAVLIVAVLLLNPVVFGLLGFIKRTAKWRFAAAGATLTIILAYGVAAFTLAG
jgi:uncharacterized membrane protein